MSEALADYRASSGRLEPVWLVSVQTVPDDVDQILDAVMEVDSLRYGNYDRNASVSAVGRETARPRPGSTTDSHVEGFEPGATETYPIVEVAFAIAREVKLLEQVMDAILHVHHYEEPVVRVSEVWESRSNYDPNNDNPNRWWNNGRGLPERSTSWTD
ncbi:MAG: hypothetical protein AB8G14_19225 [Ilumatobacter sp.]